MTLKRARFGWAAPALMAFPLSLLACGADLDSPSRADLAGSAAPTVAAAAPVTAGTRNVTPGAAFLHGRVTMNDGAIHEGRLRFGGDEEALWAHYFNGVKAENPWTGLVPPGARPTERRSLRVFGIEIVGWDRPMNLERPFMARFGDLARIEPRGDEIHVVLRSGARVTLDRYASDDLADGLRVFDARRGVADLGEWGIRSVEFFPDPQPGAAPYLLYGTVRTALGEFVGLVQWDREASLSTDRLVGETSDGPQTLLFEEIRSISRLSPERALVTALDGRELVLSGARASGTGNRGVYVDDVRYGRVLVSWDALDEVTFDVRAFGPRYHDFPAGRPLEGTVTTRDGRMLTGRLVYDLDESETTETLDAPAGGVDYSIPLGLIVSLEIPDSGAGRPLVKLRTGETLELERSGDLGEANAGLLVFVRNGDEAPEYVSWQQVAKIDFELSDAQEP